MIPVALGQRFKRLGLGPVIPDRLGRFQDSNLRQQQIGNIE